MPSSSAQNNGQSDAAGGRGPARHPAHPRRPARRADDVRRQGSRHQLSADQGCASAGERAQRARHPDRRRRLRRQQRLRRAVPDAQLREAGLGRLEVHAVAHHGAVLADAPGAAHRPQPSLGRHGQHHRDRDRGTRIHLGAAEHQGAAGVDPEAQRILDRAVRQVPRGAGLADQPGRAVHRVADGRRRVRVLLRLHRRREQPVGPGPVRGHHARSSRRRPRPRAITSPRIWPTRRSTGCASRRRCCPTSRSSCTSRPAPPTPRTTCRRSGSTSTKASSPMAGIAQREITFERQKELGVIPPDAVLTPRHAEIPAWDDMDPALKPALEREMEVYAAFLEHTDHHVGRLLDALGPILDDTLVYVIIGDNGASAEGTLQGAFNEMANFNGMADLETPEFLVSKLDEFGGEGSYGHYAVGWAWAMDSPYQWTKQVASHWGGTRNGTIVHWPNGIEDKGGVAQPVHPCHRSRAHRAGGGGHPGADDGQRRHAEPVRGHQPAVQLQRRRRARAARDAVLRDVLQPRHLPQGLERGDQAPHAVGDGRRGDACLRRRRLGTLRRQHRLDAVQRPVEGEPGETA